MIPQDNVTSHLQEITHSFTLPPVREYFSVDVSEIFVPLFPSCMFLCRCFLLLLLGVVFVFVLFFPPRVMCGRFLACSSKEIKLQWITRD